MSNYLMIDKSSANNTNSSATNLNGTLEVGQIIQLKSDPIWSLETNNNNIILNNQSQIANLSSKESPIYNNNSINGLNMNDIQSRILQDNSSYNNNHNASETENWLEMPKMDNFVDIFSVCCSIAVIFGGIIPYIPQYLKIKNSNTSDGFSTYVCLTLMLANILRIAFWFGHRFELPLLIQSFVMLIGMLAMMEICVRVRNRNSSYIISSIGVVRPIGLNRRRSSLIGKLMLRFRQAFRGTALVCHSDNNYNNENLNNSINADNDDDDVNDENTEDADQNVGMLSSAANENNESTSIYSVTSITSTHISSQNDTQISSISYHQQGQANGSMAVSSIDSMRNCSNTAVENNCDTQLHQTQGTYFFKLFKNENPQ